MKSFGEIVREVRQKKGLKAYELAEKISVNPVYITQIEKHNKLPSAVVAQMIANILEDNSIVRAYIADKKYKLEKSFKKSLARCHIHRFTPDSELQEKFNELKKVHKNVTWKKLFKYGLDNISQIEKLKKTQKKP